MSKEWKKSFVASANLGGLFDNIFKVFLYGGLLVGGYLIFTQLWDRFAQGGTGVKCPPDQHSEFQCDKLSGLPKVLCSLGGWGVGGALDCVPNVDPTKPAPEHGAYCEVGAAEKCGIENNWWESYPSCTCDTTKTIFGNKKIQPVNPLPPLGPGPSCPDACQTMYGWWQPLADICKGLCPQTGQTDPVIKPGTGPDPGWDPLDNCGTLGSTKCENNKLYSCEQGSTGKNWFETGGVCGTSHVMDCPGCGKVVLEQGQTCSDVCTPQIFHCEPVCLAGCRNMASIPGHGAAWGFGEAACRSMGFDIFDSRGPTFGCWNQAEQNLKDCYEGCGC